MTNWAVTYLVHSTVILGLGFVLSRWGSLRSASARDLFLRVSLISGLLTSTLALAVQKFSVAQPTVLAQTVVEQAGAAVQANEPASLQNSGASASTLERVAVLTLPVSISKWFDAFLLLGLMITFLRFVYALRLIHLQKQGRITDPELISYLQELPSYSGQRIKMYWTAQQIPCAYGWRQILLPHNLKAHLTPQQIRAVLAHEYAHLQRHDPLWNAALSLVTQMLWFQPLNWWALTEWRKAAEERCDVWSARHSSAHALAQALLNLARLKMRTEPSFLTTGALKDSHLSQRIAALLRPEATLMKKPQLFLLALLPTVFGVMLPPVALAASPHGLTVVLDPAHGGVDTGAVGYAVEAQVVLAVAQQVRQKLMAQGVNVLLTRDADQSLSNDKMIDLAQRVKLAVLPAAAYISLHTDASKDANEQGVTAFVGQAGTEDNLAKSRTLAAQALAGLASQTGAKNRGISEAYSNVFVLKHAQIPTILLEIGYSTNQHEGTLLNDPAYQNKLATGIAEGILKALSTR